MGVLRSKGDDDHGAHRAGPPAGRIPADAGNATPNGGASTGGSDRIVKLTIPSNTAAVRDVQDAILSEIARHGFDTQSQFAVKLALEEALINAIKHGNKLSPTKIVHVEYKVTDKQLDIMVEDQGPGFARTSVPDPTLDENIEKCSGRGILLMEAYMTRVRWSHGGRRVRMVKKNETETP